MRGNLLLVHILENVLLVAKNSISVEEYLLSKRFSREEVSKTIEATGFQRLSRFDHSDLEKLIIEASSKLHEAIAPHKDKIRAITVVSQTNEVKIPNGASILQRALGLGEDVLCLELVDGCNGFVKAMRVLDGMLNTGEVGLFFGGDFNSSMVGGSESGTRALFGDGFALTVVQKKEDLRFIIRQDGSRGDSIKYGGLDKSLVMNGFEVFAFATRAVPKLVSDFGGLSSDGVDAIALHQASKLVVERISQNLGLSRLDLPAFNASSVGNLGPASIPGWLATAAFVPSQSRIAAIGFGSGLSWGIAMLTFEATRNEIFYV